MNQIVECVPNFSEGRDSSKIKLITDAIESVSGIELLSVEPGADTHRTVVTFIGNPEAVAEAAFRSIKKASEIIDMTQHQGAHPRMGATDVCPFVPVQNIRMQECVEIAKKVGQRVGRELNIPVYMYEEAASAVHRKNLADIRQGEYEGFSKKIKDPLWKPDYGPAEFNAKSGATVIGAREFLIAYNITLNSPDKQLATELAFELREKGRISRSGNTTPWYFKGKKRFYGDNEFPCGNCDFIGKTLDETHAHCHSKHGYDLKALLKANDLDTQSHLSLKGHPIYRPGHFKACKAIGWYVDEFKRSQISINLTNYKETPPHLVLEEARKLAHERGIVITGSEIVGLIPHNALINAGKFYLKKIGKPTGVPQSDLLRTAVFSMGLSDIAPFDIQKKTIGKIRIPANALIQKSVAEFTDEVSRDTPAPGGGSISALAGALGAALASMVANLTYGKEGTEAKDPELAELAEKAQAIKDLLITCIDEDTQAFNIFLEALRLPKNTPEEKATRIQKMQEGIKIAIEVPWKTAKACFEGMKLAKRAAEIGNPNSITDAAVGTQMGYAGIRGAIWNVRINLKDVNDKAYIETLGTQTQQLLEQATILLSETEKFVDQKINELIDRPRKNLTP